MRTLPRVGETVKYCVCGMARNYTGKGIVLTEPKWDFGTIFWFYVKRGKGRIVVRTADLMEEEK